ncbi:hypothetical protein F383_19466 [Gossypium arboreum]|uniref:Uncharacterized protein n=1 Tax=Gossypium arboreum TaxID=29729 RepID=A0A0B0NVW3_GOSAR|nr:hypothetical protein F383_19466 [Gossypium arboreum]
MFNKSAEQQVCFQEFLAGSRKYVSTNKQPGMVNKKTEYA